MPTISFQGVAGAYSEEAVRQYFADAEVVPCRTFEGIFAAVVSAAGDAQLDDVAQHAEEALESKATQLVPASAAATDVPPTIPRPAIVATATILNRDGIHARPAALIVEALASSDAKVTIATDRSAPVSARSPARCGASA